MSTQSTKSAKNNSGNNKKIKFPEKFTASAIIQYVAEANNISKKQAKELLENLYGLFTAGVMSGQRVPVGTIGKLYVRVRPATKARLGRNPITGAEIQIAAKKATKVPKFVFSKSFKETTLKANVKAK
jgi:nucleoid DNA-binding protein